MFKSNKVTQSIELVGPQGQDFRIDTYKLFGDYWIQSYVIIQGIKQDFKTQRYSSKNEMFKYRLLCHDYLKDKGIW